MVSMALIFNKTLFWNICPLFKVFEKGCIHKQPNLDKKKKIL